MDSGAGYGRAALVGGAIGFVVATIVVSLIGVAAGLGRDAAAVGVFAAIWGGFGLGSMMGAIVVVTREMHGPR